MRYELLLIAGVTLSLAAGCQDHSAARAKSDALRIKAVSLVNRVADELDQRTTDAGVYVRAKDGEIQDLDPWGSRLKFAYSQGGVAEVVKVRSAGPDGQFDTEDDVTAQRMAANLKGIGNAIKDNAEETAANAAKGVVKGGISGLKESLKDAIKKKD